MKIKLKRSIAGPMGCFAAGDVVELSAEQSRQLVADGVAELVRGPVVERAVVEPLVERAVVEPVPAKPKPRPKPRAKKRASRKGK